MLLGHFAAPSCTGNVSAHLSLLWIGVSLGYRSANGKPPCSPCATGTYTGATSTVTCSACGVSLQALSVARFPFRLDLIVLLTLLQAGSTSPLASTSVAACQCDRGFTGPSGAGPCVGMTSAFVAFPPAQPDC